MATDHEIHNPMQNHVMQNVWGLGFIENVNRLKLSILSVSFLLSSCIGTDLSNWPDSIPQQQLFIDVYQADIDNQQLQSRNEYLEWVLNFYQGSLVYRSGWLDIEAEVLNTVAPQDIDRLDLELHKLGAAIGLEWAKDNRVRLIDSRMLALWGSTLQLSENYDQQLRSIEVITKDVDDLLNGQLQKSDIAQTRYAELLQLEFFDDFFGDF